MYKGFSAPPQDQYRVQSRLEVAGLLRVSAEEYNLYRACEGLELLDGLDPRGAAVELQDEAKTVLLSEEVHVAEEAVSLIIYGVFPLNGISLANQLFMYSVVHLAGGVERPESCKSFF